MKQRILSILTALCLALTLLPATAWAEGDDVDVSVNSGTALQNAINSATDSVWTTITIGSSFTLTDEESGSPGAISIPASKMILLDLNGQTITCENADTSAFCIFYIYNGGTLEITDNSTGGGGTVSLTQNGESTSTANYAAVVSNLGTFTLSGGTLELKSSANRQLEGIHTMGDTAISGGTLQVERATGNGFAYGIFQSYGDLTMTGGSIKVENNTNSNTFGIYLTGTGTREISNNANISVTNAGTAGAAGVNGGATISGGSVTVSGQNATYTYAANNATITGGTLKVTNPTGAAVATSCTISGGSFSAPGEGAPNIGTVPEGYELTKKEDGTWALQQKPGTTYVAKVGDTSYPTLTDAVSAAANTNGTVELLADVELTETLKISTGTITLNLCGHAIKPVENFPDNNALVQVDGSGGLTVTDSGSGGSIGTNDASATYGIFVSGASASAEIAGGTVMGTKIGVLVSPNSSLDVTGGTVTVTNQESNTGEAIKAQFQSVVKISGGAVQGGKGASGSTMGSAVSALGSSVEISGNARLSGYSGVSLYNLRTTDNGSGVLDNNAEAISSTLYMTGGSIDTSLYAVTGNNTYSACSKATISGGTIKTTEGTAIYWPMEGTLTINGTASVTGPTAIEIKMGTLNISDSATITGTAEYKDPDSSETTGDGIAQADGSALRVSAEKYGSAGQYEQYINSPNLTVTVTGGTFTSTYGNAIAVYNTEAEANVSALTVTGGTLTPAEGRAAVAYISEKTPTSATESTVTSGEMTTTKTNTTVTVSQDAAKAAVTTEGTTSYYNTVDEALEAANKTEVADKPIEVAVFGNGTVSAENLALKDNITLTVAANVELDVPVTSGETGMVVTASTDTQGNTVYKLKEQESVSTSYEAQIGEVYYATLADAVGAVQNEQTITLLKACSGTITISRPVTFNINTGSITGNTYQILAGAGYTLSVSGNTYTVAYVPPVTPDDDTPSYDGGSSSEPTYSNILDVSDGGTIKVSPRTPEAGETVTITPTPDQGYDVGSVTVTDRNGREIEVTEHRNSTYTFEQPRGRVTIEVTFVPTGEVVSEMPFLDVAPGAWYADAVAYVYEHGLMSGTSATAFSPNTTTTRAMIVTMLYRLEGEPSVSFGSSFNDVDASMYYAGAVAWASQNGIVTGYDEATFGPNDAITREQMAAILYRYAQYKGYDTDVGGMAIREYEDYESISEYALSAMGWAVSEGLVTGTSGNTLTPAGSAIRAQIATIFMRFIENIIE